MNPDGTDHARGRLVQVYRSPLRDGMYLIVDRREGLERVPEPLLQRFGRPQPSIVFLLRPDRPLARSEPQVVLDALTERGFHLQMPPSPEEEGTNDR
ncbi:MAG: YcgL domain-containing protein [Gammaproteobacteria bacterium]|nr:YcgL domain-containing protein [Gammaproteobacteria bacterium]